MHSFRNQRIGVISFDDLYIERTPMYEKYANITIESEKNDLVETAKKIIGNLGLSIL